jgi:HEPN domain-containing protein
VRIENVKYWKKFLAAMSKRIYFDNVLFEKFIRQGQQYAKTSKENKPLAEKWLTIAQDDIQITKLLFANNHYAGATYHLQQAFEKLTKGYYMLTGRLEPEQASGHFFVLKKLKSEIKDEHLKNFIKLSNSATKHNFDFQSVEKSMKLFEQPEDEIRLMNKSDIDAILAFLKKVESMLTSSETVNSLDKKVHEKKVITGLKSLIIQITRFRTSLSQVRSVVKREQVVKFLDGAVISTKLLLISLLTFLHYNTPRYPYDKGSKVTYFNYDTNLGIVSVIPDLIVIFEDLLFKIRLEYIGNSRQE